jgi:hypothetical protein
MLLAGQGTVGAFMQVGQDLRRHMPQVVVETPMVPAVVVVVPPVAIALPRGWVALEEAELYTY